MEQTIEFKPNIYGDIIDMLRFRKDNKLRVNLIAGFESLGKKSWISAIECVDKEIPTKGRFLNEKDLKDYVFLGQYTITVSTQNQSTKQNKKFKRTIDGISKEYIKDMAIVVKKTNLNKNIFDKLEFFEINEEFQKQNPADLMASTLNMSLIDSAKTIKRVLDQSQKTTQRNQKLASIIELCAKDCATKQVFDDLKQIYLSKAKTYYFKGETKLQQLPWGLGVAAFPTTGKTNICKDRKMVKWMYDFSTRQQKLAKMMNIDDYVTACEQYHETFAAANKNDAECVEIKR